MDLIFENTVELSMLMSCPSREISDNNYNARVSACRSTRESKCEVEGRDKVDRGVLVVMHPGEQRPRGVWWALCN